MKRSLTRSVSVKEEHEETKREHIRVRSGSDASFFFCNEEDDNKEMTAEDLEAKKVAAREIVVKEKQVAHQELVRLLKEKDAANLDEINVLAIHEKVTDLGY